MAIHHIHIKKAGKNATVEVDDSVFGDETFAAIVAAGLDALLNAKMTKVGAVTKLEGEELAKASAMAMDIAKRNLADLAAGTYKFAGKKAKSPEKREVVNEAMRMARDIIRDALRDQGIKVSHVPAKDITAAARQMVESTPSLIEEAKANLAKRTEIPEAKIDLAKLGIKADPAKVAKAEEAKAKRKENLSAAQAGRTKARSTTTKSKPKAEAADVLASVSAHGHQASTHTTH